MTTILSTGLTTTVTKTTTSVALQRLGLVASVVLSAIALSLAGCAADGDGSGMGDDDDSAPAATTRLGGVVTTPRADGGADAVPFALVTVDGVGTVEADATGRFALEGVPADGPILVRVSGPEDPALDRRLFAPTALVVSPTGEATQVYPVLPIACEGFVDGAVGGELVLDDCGGAGSARIRVDGGLVDDDGRAFAGSVRVLVAVADPASPGDLLGFPDAGDGVGAGPGTLGAITVELEAAADGAPLALAEGTRATVDVDILAPPEDEEAEPPQLLWFDPDQGAWVPQAGGMVVGNGGGPRFRFETDHFSSFAASTGPAPSAPACLTAAPVICPRGSSDCEPRPVMVEAVDLTGHGGVVRRLLGPSSEETECIEVAAGSDYQLTFRYANVLATSIFGDPVYQAVSRARIPDDPGDGSPTCPGDCVDLGEVALYPLPYGCATGVLEADTGDPIEGPVEVYLGDDHVSSVVLPPSCGGELCMPVPIDTRSGLEVTLRDRLGQVLSFEADLTTIGESCPRIRPFPESTCDGAGSCQPLGTLTANCEADDGCISAFFTVTVGRAGDAGCPADEHPVFLDASRSAGPITHYGWRRLVARPVGEGVDRFVLGYGPSPTLDVCLPEGTHTISLNASSPPRARRRRIDYFSRRVTVGAPPAEPLPCASTTVEASGVESRSCDWASQPDGRTVVSCEGAGGETITTTYDEGPCGFGCITAFPFRQATRIESTFGTTTSVVTQTFNVAGHLIRLESETPEADAVTIYDLDDLAQPNTVEVMAQGATEPNSVATLTWADGRLEAISTDHYGVPGDPNDFKDIVYDAAGRVDEIDGYTSNGSAMVEVGALYERDEDGRVIQSQPTINGVVQRTVTYSYECP